MDEPRKFTSTTTIPHGSYLKLTLTGEQYSGNPILDTKVEIDAGNLCWITWADKDKFIGELKSVIDKYAI
jgi:hypothetical protein